MIARCLVAGAGDDELIGGQFFPAQRLAVDDGGGEQRVGGIAEAATDLGPERFDMLVEQIVETDGKPALKLKCTGDGNRDGESGGHGEAERASHFGQRGALAAKQEREVPSGDGVRMVERKKGLRFSAFRHRCARGG